MGVPDRASTGSRLLRKGEKRKTQRDKEKENARVLDLIVRRDWGTERW